MKILAVFGTRPEAIKMLPLILRLRRDFDTRICVTGQHREMLHQMLDLFQVRPDYDLNLMKPNQDLAHLTGEILGGVARILQNKSFDWVLVQGDTNSTMAGAMAAFYQNVKVGHVEAGLRTHDITSPFPEEMNRQITSKMATLHFAATKQSKNNLLSEGVSDSAIHVTGNTVIDALHWVLKNFPAPECPLPFDPKKQRMLLVTSHRRENFGEGTQQIIKAIESIARQQPDVQIVYPVHLNPNIRRPVFRVLSDLPNVHLLDPLDYPCFVHLMNCSVLILTDSGGVQEEAPSLGKPVLVMRDSTERPEAIAAGTVRLVGARQDVIVDETLKLLNEPETYRSMAHAHNPYGDGTACEQIANCIRNYITSEGVS